MRCSRPLGFPSWSPVSTAASSCPSEKTRVRTCSCSTRRQHTRAGIRYGPLHLPCCSLKSHTTLSLSPSPVLPAPPLGLAIFSRHSHERSGPCVPLDMCGVTALGAHVRPSLRFNIHSLRPHPSARTPRFFQRCCFVACTAPDKGQSRQVAAGSEGLPWQRVHAEQPS